LRANFAATAARRGLAVEEVERAALAAVPVGRFGDPAEFGQLCAYLCSRQAGYITGQNLLIDGGANPGLL
jgi:3-oxoacyl-[acyl-carrier protein] reductase